jgi:hypothetical protein
LDKVIAMLEITGKIKPSDREGFKPSDINYIMEEVMGELDPEGGERTYRYKGFVPMIYYAGFSRNGLKGTLNHHAANSLTGQEEVITANIMVEGDGEIVKYVLEKYGFSLDDKKPEASRAGFIPSETS